MINKYKLKKTHQDVLALIIKKPGLSRADIAKIFNFNKSTASYLIKDLETQKLIKLVQGTNTNGRKGVYIHFNYHYEKVLFIEYGKRKIKSWVCTLDEEIFDSHVININEEAKREAYLTEHIVNLKKKYPMLKNCIFAVHGMVNFTKDKVSSPFYNTTMENLKSIFYANDINTFIENESNIYALGISSNSSDSFNKVSANIQIKDGVGCGLVLNGQLFRGFNGMAGEIGHTIAITEGKPCNCGNHGCLELYASDSNILLDCSQKLAQNITRQNFGKYYQQSLYIQDLMEFNIKLLANAINNIYVTLNPTTINITSEIYSQIPNVKKTLENHLQSTLLPKPTINIYEYQLTTLIKGCCKLYLSLIV